MFVALEAIPDSLVSGMAADASVILEQRSEVMKLPRSLVRSRSDGRGNVRVWADGRAEQREVQVGLRGDISVEIIEGLVEGDEVIAE